MFQFKNTLLNDGDIKVISNKFQWKYFRQDKVNLLVYGDYQPYFKQKQKIILQNFGQLAFFDLLFSAF